jgi:hypothetical protein
MTPTLTLLAYDEGKQTLGLVHTDRPGEGWTMSLAELPLARDLQRLDRGRALVGFDRGYFEVDLANGRIVKVVDRWKNVSSVRRLANGHTLVVGLDLDGGTGGIVVLTLDAHDTLVKTARREGTYVRLLRPTPEGTWLIGADDHFLETDEDLVEVRSLAAPGFRHAWMAHRYTDGTTLVSGGYGPFFAVFARDGALVRTFGAKDQVPAEVSPNFYASFEFLDRGMVVANWQGHGPANGAKGRQLVFFGPDGEYQGSWSDPERISSLQGILVL